MSFLRMTRREALALGASLPAAALAPVAARAENEVSVATPYGLPISPEFPFEKKRVSVKGSEIAYVDEGEGRPVLFLHGNPSSSYLWRNVIPYVAAGHRAIAPDLIGMGDSAKPDIGYTLADHIEYMDAFIASLGLMDFVIVAHDWGSIIGASYARRNPKRVRAVAFMEALFPPSLPAPSYEALGPLEEMFRALRTEGLGEEMVLQNNFFVEKVLPMMVSRTLDAAEMDAYRAPFQTPESRRPTLQWPREIPIGGAPAFANREVLAAGEWLHSSELPKLMFYAEPGAIAPKPVVDHMIANVQALETRFVGAGRHFIQEDHPHVIGRGLADWLRRLNA